MAQITELNRKPDIEANQVDAEAVSANDYNNGAIDHDQTGNRTHSGDDLSPNSVDAGSVSADDLSGGVLDRSEAITNLEGNIHLEPDGTDPETVLENDGDIVFLHE